MKRHIIRCAAAFALAVVAGALVPTGVHAGVRTVVPEQFRAMNNLEPVEITPPHIRPYSANPASFWAPVRLPAGARITKLELYSWGTDKITRTVTLLRSRLNAPHDLPDQLMTVDSSDINPPPDPPTVTATTDPISPESDLVVKPAYRYFVEAVCDDWYAYISGVKVYFR